MVARKWHEERARQFEAGEIDAGTWRREQDRRNRNRVRGTWKGDPWAPGQTISLGCNEEAFRASLATEGLSLDELSPFALDRARWTWRRAFLDRGTQSGIWQEFVRERLRRMIQAAGPAPEDWGGHLDMSAEPWVVLADKPPSPYSKRRRVAPPKATGSTRKRALPSAKPAELADEADFAMMVAENRTELAGPLSRCQDEKEERLVLATFRAVLDAPGDASALKAWHKLLIALNG